jgi:hypothetical protein
MEKETIYVGVPSRESAEEVIAWALDFMNLNLASMDQNDQWKLVLDLHQHLTVRLNTDGKTPSPDLNVKLLNVQKSLREFFNRSVKPALKAKELTQLPPPGCEKFRFQSEESFFFKDHERLVFASYGSPFPEVEAVEQFKAILMQACPLDASSFMECKGCHNYFFQLRRKQKYCSRLCNLRHYAKKTRGEKGTQKRKEYNKKQRELMKKRYDEKR